jgi:hypothetical protein
MYQISLIKDDNIKENGYINSINRHWEHVPDAPIPDIRICYLNMVKAMFQSTGINLKK